jgi:hypothetical protein
VAHDFQTGFAALVPARDLHGFVRAAARRSHAPRYLSEDDSLLHSTVSRKSLLVLTLAATLVLALLVGLLRDMRSRPYHVDRASLSGWTVVLGAPEDPWVVALEPPAGLTASLLRQVQGKVDRPVVAPRHAALPLVMRQEHDEALQGVYGPADIQRIARQALVAESTFEPVCIAHRVDPQGAAAGELYFLAVSSPAFNTLRVELQPDFPEHAGIGVYDAGALTAVLPIATSGTDFGRWWPIRLERLTDCEAEVTVE